ncbi:glycosyl hydrolase, family 43 [Verrucomicrobiia bacterium DG1235]|nr:glycosyl hydrolase, family 43 [Verrucomicrobiae bacterium DG1235]
MRPLQFCFLLIISLSSMASHGDAAPEIPNPLVEQRADPWIHKHDDGSYYLIATVPAYDRIEMRRSKTIAGLACAEPKTVWKKHESGIMGAHIWAPELHFLDGKWYIYFAAGEAENVWNIRMYVLEGDAKNPLDSEWKEKGQIKTAWESFSLDATILEHRDNRYLIWAQYSNDGKRNSNLYISKMDTPWSITGPQTLLTTPEFDWEIQTYRVNEGAAALKRNGKIFVTYSASATDHSYAMGLLYADEDANLLDPNSWTKESQPVFASDETSSIYGPGHNSFTQDEDGNDILVYHARNYKELLASPLADPNRHTRAKTFTWTQAGMPDFGTPQPDSPAKKADKPLYRDPTFDGTADPVVLWNPERARYWMFYTNRRAKAEDLSGVAWVHGTHLGIAESCDGGATWNHHAIAQIHLPPELENEEETHWAPEVITAPDGTHHMYLTLVPGVFEDWGHPRDIVHLTSSDLLNWDYQSTLSLASDRVIDACVLPLEDGTWRMWYNNERDGKSIYYADSPDLYTWTDKSKAVGDKSGEGPKVFRWKGYYWMITDVWSGLAVYRSDDALNWTRQSGENLLQTPGKGLDDAVIGGHPDIVLQGERAYLFYFTHPGRTDPSLPDGYETRRSSIQVVELYYKDGKLHADRDQPCFIKLDPRFAP